MYFQSDIEINALKAFHQDPWDDSDKLQFVTSLPRGATLELKPLGQEDTAFEGGYGE